MYNYITEARKMSCRVYKCPFWANVENLDNVGGGGVLGGGPVLADQAQAAKNLKFCKFFIFNELPTFLWYIFLKFFCCRFLGTGVFWTFLWIFVRGSVFGGILGVFFGLGKSFCVYAYGKKVVICRFCPFSARIWDFCMQDKGLYARGRYNRNSGHFWRFWIFGDFIVFVMNI